MNYLQAIEREKSRTERNVEILEAERKVISIFSYDSFAKMTVFSDEVFSITHHVHKEGFILLTITDYWNQGQRYVELFLSGTFDKGGLLHEVSLRPEKFLRFEEELCLCVQSLAYEVLLKLKQK